MLLINHEEKFLIHFVHFLLLVGHVVVLRFLEQLTYALFAEELDQCFVLR